MEYIKDNYYQNKEDSKVIRFVNKRSEDIFEFYDLLADELKIIHFKSNPFMKLGITICRISELKTGATKGIGVFKSFMKEMNFKKNYELNLIESDYCIVGDNSDTVKVDDDINDFFNKIEILKGCKLSIEQKDKFLIKEFSK